jgi:hypothetical protein
VKQKKGGVEGGDEMEPPVSRTPTQGSRRGAVATVKPRTAPPRSRSCSSREPNRADPPCSLCDTLRQHLPAAASSTQLSFSSSPDGCGGGLRTTCAPPRSSPDLEPTPLFGSQSTSATCSRCRADPPSLESRPSS